MAKLDLQDKRAENWRMQNRDPNRIVPGLGELSRERGLVDGTESECVVEVGGELKARSSDAECRSRRR